MGVRNEGRTTIRRYVMPAVNRKILYWVVGAIIAWSVFAVALAYGWDDDASWKDLYSSYENDNKIERNVTYYLIAYDDWSGLATDRKYRIRYYASTSLARILEFLNWLESNPESIVRGKIPSKDQEIIGIYKLVPIKMEQNEASQCFNYQKFSVKGLEQGDPK